MVPPLLDLQVLVVAALLLVLLLLQQRHLLLLPSLCLQQHLPSTTTTPTSAAASVSLTAAAAAVVLLNCHHQLCRVLLMFTACSWVLAGVLDGCSCATWTSTAPSHTSCHACSHTGTGSQTSGGCVGGGEVVGCEGGEGCLCAA